MNDQVLREDWALQVFLTLGTKGISSFFSKFVLTTLHVPQNFRDYKLVLIFKNMSYKIK